MICGGRLTEKLWPAFSSIQARLKGVITEYAGGETRVITLPVRLRPPATRYGEIQ